MTGYFLSKTNNRKVRKYIDKHSINATYINQWIIYHVKTYILLGTLRYNCARGQLSNEGGGEL